MYWNMSRVKYAGSSVAGSARDNKTIKTSSATNAIKSSLTKKQSKRGRERHESINSDEGESESKPDIKKQRNTGSGILFACPFAKHSGSRYHDCSTWSGPGPGLHRVK
ncbi:hypothetical protein RUND412_008268 [Rhizina undulata]